MLDKLFSLMKQENASRNLREILSAVECIIENFEDEFLEDADDRNEVIDCVIELLETYKYSKKR